MPTWWRCTCSTTTSCRTHEALRVTPAMEAGVVDHFMEIGDLVQFLEVDPRLTPKKRGPYRRRVP